MIKLTISERDVKVMLEDSVLCFFVEYVIKNAKRSKYGYDGKEVDEDNIDKYYYFECDDDIAKIMYNAIIGSCTSSRIYDFLKKLNWKLNNKKEVEENG